MIFLTPMTKVSTCSQLHRDNGLVVIVLKNVNAAGTSPTRSELSDTDVELQFEQSCWIELKFRFSLRKVFFFISHVKSLSFLLGNVFFKHMDVQGDGAT